MTFYKTYHLRRKAGLYATLVALAAMVFCFMLGLPFEPVFAFTFITFLVSYIILLFLLYDTIPDNEGVKRPKNIDSETDMELFKGFDLDDPDLLQSDGGENDFEGTARDSGLDAIVESIENDLHTQWIKGEKDLENLVFNLINGKYPGIIKRNAGASGGVACIVVDGRYGILSKVIDREETMYNLIGHIVLLADDYEKVAAILFVDRYLNSRADLGPYLRKLEEYDVTVLVKEGFIEKSSPGQ